MTKEQLHEIVNSHNRPIKNQRDMRISQLLFTLVERLSKIEGWSPAEFFGGEADDKVQEHRKVETVRLIPVARVEYRHNRLCTGGDV